MVRIPFSNSRRAASPAAVAALVWLVACGGSFSSPEGAVGTWLEALEASDSARVREAFTDRTWELVSEIHSLSRDAEDATGHPGITLTDWCQAFCGAAVEGSTLHGDSATVRIRIDDQVEEIPVVRQGGGWRIDFAGRLEPAMEMLRLAVGQGGVEEPDTAGAADTTPPPADTAP